jgi:hypothetical protein
MMARNYFSVPLFLTVLFIAALLNYRCKPEEEIIDIEFLGGLQFSNDTVFFDTVFSGAGSTTRRLKVFNPSPNAQKIRSIRIGGGSTSPFKVILNGFQIENQEELTLLGGDSTLLLIEVFIDPKNENSPYLVKDSIVFETNGGLQNVKLVAWGQDALYVGNEVLPCNTIWAGNRPIVMFSSVLVDTLCSLTIEKGARIFAAKDAYLYVKGQLTTQGTADERIVFRNDRLEPQYENIPGQWGGIIFLEGTYANELNYTTIRNAIYGVRLGAPDQDTIPEVVLKNIIIENMSHSGIISFSSDLYAENTLVNNCIEFICANIAGGNYTFKHCTFANYSQNFLRQSPSFFVSDNIRLDDNSSIVQNINITLQNSIVFGDQAEELFFDLSGGADFTFAFNNNLLKSTISGLDTLGNILNQDPQFIDKSRYNYRLDTLSPAKDKGNFIDITNDLDGNIRDANPDMGAYERIE